MVERMQPPHQTPPSDRRGRTVPWHYQREAAAGLVTGLPGVVATIRGSSVELIGTAFSVGQVERASRAAWAMPGVATVRNEIHVFHEADQTDGRHPRRR